ncbi:hypothetical protein [Glaciecola sp. 1036]|uniref:hypothetical protein n=1 Tax=Alteromonadaceae TaxID=72275 RepID=UPI003D015B37
MSDHNSQKDALSSLYQKRKKQHLAPENLKRRVFNHTNQKQDTGYSLFSNKNRIVLASLAVVFAIAFLQLPSFKNQQAQSPLLIVEVHSLAGEKTSIAQAHRIEYENLQQNLILRQDANRIAHQQRMRVLDTSDGITLVDCNAQAIQITRSLLDSLNQSTETGSIDTKLAKGNILDLGFDAGGHIIAVSSAGNAEFCPETAE